MVQNLTPPWMFNRGTGKLELPGPIEEAIHNLAAVILQYTSFPLLSIEIQASSLHDYEDVTVYTHCGPVQIRFGEPEPF